MKFTVSRSSEFGIRPLVEINTLEELLEFVLREQAPVTITAPEYESGWELEICDVYEE